MGARFRSCSCVLIILLCVCFSGIVSVCGESRGPKNVQVAVRAKWEGTSVLLEAGIPKIGALPTISRGSLSSFPLSDDSISNNGSGGIAEITEKNESKRSDPLLVGVNPKSPGGKCCWVDTGGALFFDVAELLLWLHNPPKL
ncbi:hypothetical protein GH714_005035 [Hevea brasiliensis]|uniref:Uncharacterized protein n=1 Tax=Hevea brasiliensis TaxID=3981 RepID=A0A6A6L0S2_HEVBR|nr:hypothetical protein GH714_005035 [Hevea brasiliensis]